MKTININGPSNIHHPPPHMCGPWYGQSGCCAQADDDSANALIAIPDPMSKFFMFRSFSLMDCGDSILVYSRPAVWRAS
jgi:hypothetical protein